MNILVVRTDKIGDFITALPTLFALKKYSPENSITVCIAPINKELAQACTFIDNIIIDDGKSSVMEFAKMLQSKNFDASITLFSTTRVALYQAIAQIPIRIAPATKIAQIFYNRRVKQRRSEVKMAEFEYNLYLLKVLFEDIELTYDFPLIEFNEEDLTPLYDSFYTPLNITKPIIALHPNRDLTLNASIEMANLINQHNKYQVVMTFGPDDQTLFDKAQKETEGMDIILYNSKDGIVNFLKLLSTFELFISASIETYHLAALAGIKTMYIYKDSPELSINPQEMQYYLSLKDVKLKNFNDLTATIHTLEKQVN